LDVLVPQLLIAASLLGISLWWYRRNLGEKSGHAGRVLWFVWVIFGVLSLVILVFLGLEALLLGGAVTWIFCVAGTLLGTHLLMRSFPARASEFGAFALVFALGSALLGFFVVLILVGSVLRSSSSDQAPTKVYVYRPGSSSSSGQTS
jgi:hypothetical protein